MKHVTKDALCVYTLYTFIKLTEFYQIFYQHKYLIVPLESSPKRIYKFCKLMTLEAIKFLIF
jgi:hypothetical protein